MNFTNLINLINLRFAPLPAQYTVFNEFLTGRRPGKVMVPHSFIRTNERMRNMPDFPRMVYLITEKR